MTHSVQLTPRQLSAFLDDDLDGTGPCRVREDLALDDLAGTDVLPNARILLAELERGRAKLTGKGRLNREFVAILMERFQWRDLDPAGVRAVSKVVNEGDFPPARYLHAVLKLSGLVRRDKGYLVTTRKGRDLLAEEQAGRLQATLFRTTFVRYNPAYLDAFDMPEVFAPQISLILFLIGQFRAEWRPAEAILRSTTLPIRELTEPSHPRLPPAAFSARVLRYLHWFGLMEEGQGVANQDWGQPRLYRKTALYDRMLRFAVP
jgi:hypothetical protein